MTDVSRQKPLLLIADDDAELMGIILKRLQQLDEYEFITASDGESAVQMIRERRPDAVILDVMMPRKNGWEVLKEIRKDDGTKNTGVLMLTGIGAKLNEITSPLHGADEYIDKPFNFSELLFKIKRVLTRRS
jgi:two-component system alkaline phosphatase synthesis response regulator PhoP